MVLELASLEKKKKKKKKKEEEDDFLFFQNSFTQLELKSEDIFVLRRVRAFSGYSFCWLNPQTTCLFTLAYCTVKTFQPLHTTAIDSDSAKLFSLRKKLISMCVWTIIDSR